MASLEEQQRALAARLTAGAREKDTKLSQDLLQEFDALELQQSRETLVRKRLGQIANLMPKTRRDLGSEYERLCRTFIDEHHFQGLHAIQLDAIHFARWLKTQATVEPKTLDISSFEALRIQWMISSFFIAIRRFKYHLGSDQLQDGEAHKVSRSMWIAIRIGQRGIFRGW